MKKCEDCTDYSCPHRWMECFYEYEAELQASEEFKEKAYWQSFRAEAAKDILCALLNRESTMSMNGKIVTDYKDFIEMAIIDADLLIAKLKEKEEKNENN